MTDIILVVLGLLTCLGLVALAVWLRVVRGL